MPEANHKRIRILHVVGSMNRAGVETWLMHVLRHIDREQFQMDFLVHSATPGAYDHEIRELGGKLIPCPHTRNPFAYARAFRRILRDHGPYDVVHSHVQHFSGLIMPVAKVADVPVRIAHSHLDTSHLHAAASFIRRLYHRLAERLIRTFATDGLAASQVAASALFGQGWGADARFRVLYCGIDLAPFRLQRPNISLRDEFGIPEGAFVVGHVGRFDAQKNHAFLLEVAENVIQRDADVYFLLVGDGPLRPGIEQAVIEAGLEDRVVFAGSRSDVPYMMTEAMDAFIFPSMFEGLPLVLMEAQAAGLPVIVSGAVAPEADIVPRLISRLSLDDAESWTTAIDILRQDGRPVLHTSAYTQVSQGPFNIEHGVRELERLYAVS